MKKITMVYAVMLFVIVNMLAGCGGRTGKPVDEIPEGYCFTDALGQEVAVRNPEHVVALMGSFAEVWQAAGGRLSGVTDDAFNERGMELSEETVSVGKYNSPNVEKIIALNPELVLLSSETKEHTALKEVLKQAGITAAYFKVTYFEDYLSMLKTCTEITGRKEMYQKKGLDIKTEIEEILAGTKNQEPPSVLLLITYSGGAVAQNSRTMTGKMLHDLGCKNIADENQSLLKEFSMESIIKEDPDYIFVIPMGNDDALAMKNLEESIEKNPAWNGLTAVKNNRYILLPKEKFLYKPNEKWGESYQYLSEILYGKK
ncbi:ABC transporter substrate-binding protein [Lacrimispora sp. BS-2]|uniref:ABC transporter substrate-binding protein n=1 Tax=Lacrimispora sp. BS-2 TaxID=3151850 RepID=A0AAU7PTK1_9FIRM